MPSAAPPVPNSSASPPAATHRRHRPAQAQRAFDDALAGDLGGWPFQRSRLLLAYSEWLRRQRRIAESRGPLRAARDMFDGLDCSSFSERALRELHASGESSRRRDPATS